MKKYKLTLYWKFPETVSVVKEFINKREANKWKDNCLAICGKNSSGEKYTSWSLERV